MLERERERESHALDYTEEIVQDDSGKNKNVYVCVSTDDEEQMYEMKRFCVITKTAFSGSSSSSRSNNNSDK